jgi:cytochrome c oxidase assembly protein subunit 15
VKAASALESGSRGFTLASLRGAVEYRYFAILTTIVTYGLIVLGGTVRSTESGTACPDWPLCHGKVVPQFEYHVMIEYSHRLVASLVGFLMLGMMVWGWRRYPGQPLYRVGAVMVGALLAGQVLLGGATVKTETAATVVAAHLTMALTLFSILILMTVAAFRLDSGGSLPQHGGLLGRIRSLLTLPLATLIGLFALIIVGAYVSQMEAGLVYPDWPLFDGTVVSSGGRLADIHYAHRLLALIEGILLAGLAWKVFSEDDRAVPQIALSVAAGFYVTQVLVGASNIWFDLATPVRIIHLALASAVWASLFIGIIYRHLYPSQLTTPEGVSP